MVPTGGGTPDHMQNSSNGSINSDNQRGIMKRPARRRTRGVVVESSAGECQSEATACRYRLDPTLVAASNSPLISARYNRRRASCNVTFGVQEDQEEEDKNVFANPPFEDFDLSSRRMSAPELPPISDSGNNSSRNIINNQNLTSRSRTFHNYRFNKNGLNRNSVHSDSSLQGFRVQTTNSRTSSSSSQKSRGRVLSAGTENRTSKLASPESIQENSTSEQLKLESVNMKNGMALVAHPRSSSVNGFRRAGTKLSVYSTNVTAPRKVVPNKSDPKLYSEGKRQMTGIKRNNSENKLTDSKRNVKHSQTNGYVAKENKESVPRGRTAVGNLNGLRKYSSTLGINSLQGLKSEEDLEERLGVYVDSDSDSEKDTRVIEWIIGTAQEELEPPEEQVIEYVDEPPQRDTAIRIVYDGDS